MIFPLISVTAIGLYFALRAPEGSDSIFRTARIALLGAWIGYLAGAGVGFIVEMAVIGGFWMGLTGHIGAYLAAKTATSGRTISRIQKVSSS